MFLYQVDSTFTERDIPLGLLEVDYGESASWNREAFYEFVHSELAELPRKFQNYERKEAFGENPYFRFFRKFKKTYPVMLQFESVAFKGRPFPKENPVMEIPFLFELVTWMLSGTHDLEQTNGCVTFFSPDTKLTFTGIRGEEIHTYPKDICARDETDIILSMIAGADDRTCVREDSQHVFHPIFGTPGMSNETMKAGLDKLESMVKILAPEAVIESVIL